jgi:hypothetical protein
LSFYAGSAHCLFVFSDFWSVLPGNGFRGIPMCFYLSQIKRLFDIEILLIPLCPRHAFNLSDGHIAHLNMFFNKIMAKSYLEGADTAFEYLQEGVRLCKTGAQPGKLLKRVTPLRRHLLSTDVVSVPADLQSFIFCQRRQKTKLGVMSLCYFDFSTLDREGNKVWPEGEMRVREFANTRTKPEAGNPLMVIIPLFVLPTLYSSTLLSLGV